MKVCLAQSAEDAESQLPIEIETEPQSTLIDTIRTYELISVEISLRELCASA